MYRIIRPFHFGPGGGTNIDFGPLASSRSLDVWPKISDQPLKGEALDVFETALYFPIAGHTTIGYGVIVLPPEWRLLGGIEGVTGVLMFGLLTGAIFAAAERLLATQVERNRTSAGPEG